MDEEVADAAYIYLQDEIRAGGAAKTYPCDPRQVDGTINLDFDFEGSLIGIEVLDASHMLPAQLLMRDMDHTRYWTAPLERRELVERLAQVSHRTWMRQKSRDQGVAMETMSADVTEHDRERAEDTVAELERLQVLKPPHRAE